MNRRNYLSACAGGIIAISGCLSSGSGDEEPEDRSDETYDLESHQDFVDEYKSFRDKISNGIEDYERGHDLVDSEEFLSAEERFRDAERNFNEIHDNLLDFRTDIRMEYDEESEVVQTLDDISAMVMSYRKASEQAKRGCQDLADGSEAGWILVNGGREVLEEHKTDLPSRAEFDNMLYSE